VVFNTGGIIKLNTSVVIRNPFITIAGQTAPGDGIALRASGLIIGTHDVIVRGMRFRIGDDPDGEVPNSRDGINISSTKTGQDIYSVIIDHCSVSWGVDENLSTWTDKIDGITFQWCISSEALDSSIHVDEGQTQPAPHSKGMILGKNIRNVSVHHCLFVNNVDRNPLISGVVNCEFINNVIYNWGGGPAKTSSDKNVVHFIGNYYKLGIRSRYDCFRFSDTPGAGTAIYLKDNWRYDPDVDKNGGQYWTTVNGDTSIMVNTLQFTPSNISVQEAREAYQTVLEGAGVKVPARDTVDQRAMDNTRHHFGNFVNSPTDVGGWPVYSTGSPPLDTDNDGMPTMWEQTYGLNPDSADHNGTDLHAGGYTNIEVYINGLIDSLVPSGVKNPIPMVVPSPRDMQDGSMYNITGKRTKPGVLEPGIYLVPKNKWVLQKRLVLH
jgi:hypothetical protein